MPREFKDNLVEIKDGQPYICDESRNAVPCGVSTAPNNNKLGHWFIRNAVTSFNYEHQKDVDFASS
jgi:hypothetical protein